jgi:chemotaxis protein methyltransferase CheR
MLLVQANKETLSDADFERISDVVYRHCGINLHDGKKELVRARIAKQMRVGGFDSAAGYVDHVLADPDGDAFYDFIDSISTNLTSFFREVGHFHHLTDVFLPALLAKRRKANSGRVRAWSAGCSTGEEPHSLALTLLDALERFGPPAPGCAWDVKLLATDISTRVLRKAKAGRYSKDRVSSIPAAMRSQHCLPVGAAGGSGRAAAAARGEEQMFEMSPAVRRLISFRYLNLMEPWPFAGPFDFIFCRNVMIYFDKPTQQKLVGRYFDVLEPGGLLFTGHSESLTGIAHKFRYVQPTIYQKP